jgi:hypothetical protein
MLSQYINDIIIPARIYHYFYNNDILDKFDKKFKTQTCGINYIEAYETWVGLELDTFKREYEVVLYIRCNNLNEWYMSFDDNSNISIMPVFDYMNTEMSSLMNHYDYMSNTLTTMLLCVRALCDQWLISDIYQMITSRLQNMLPQLRHDCSLDNDKHLSYIVL